MTQTNFPKKEEEILAFWKENNIFQKALEKTSPKGDFVFYDGPPFATGLPHYGHIIAGTIKDVIPRYKTMRGFRVARRWGWDCHGLPIENLIEQEKGIKEKKEIEADIAGFNRACRDSVLRYRDEWKKSVDRTGRWVDMENDYKTMDNRYIEVIWWIFKELYRDGLIYEGYKSMHLCPRCETTLSNFEVTLGYENVKDIGITAKFLVKNSESLLQFIYDENAREQIQIEKVPVFFLVWTTTGWTLPGNMALAVGEKFDYVIAQVLDQAEIASTSSEEPPRFDKSFFIIAEKALRKTDKENEYMLEEGPLSQRQIGLKKVGGCKGGKLVDNLYHPLFNFSVQQIKNDPNFYNAFKVYAAKFVNTEEGTGIVHIAPAFGSEDYEFSVQNNLPFLQHINSDGSFKEYVPVQLLGSVKTRNDRSRGDRAISTYLQQMGRWFSEGICAHSYPHCWRCDTPLINYAASSWFVKVTALKERLLEANARVNWVPEHIKDGRFGKWLEGARDWAISRSRYWGAPLPVWRCESCKDIKVIGSVAELGQNKTPEKSEVLSCSAKDLSFAGTQKSRQLEAIIDSPSNFVNSSIQNKKAPAEGLEPSQSELSDPSVRHAADISPVYQKQEHGTIDLHRPYIDEIVLSCGKCGGVMRRIHEVFDCWFESGAMPYASELIFSNYKIMPQTTRDELRRHIQFPADFIAEGTDQTRGWFYTLMVLGVALYGESPFKNVIVNGIILAEDGQKMSKRLKNYPDPQVIMDKYGADAMRFYLMSSPAVRAEALNFSEKGVDEVYKKVILLTLNVVQFWKTYCESSKFKTQNSKSQLKTQNLHLLDVWILARLNACIGSEIEGITGVLKGYEIDKACHQIMGFIGELSTWYVRRSRERFKTGGSDGENAGKTLQYVLQMLAKLMAPICPFLAEYVYKEVGGELESVHLDLWPEERPVNDELEWFMLGIRIICEVGHSIRADAGIKVRQVLRTARIRKDFFKQDHLSAAYHEQAISLITEELNVKEVEFVDKLIDEEGWKVKQEIALNIVLDDDLKEQGTLRELTRQINNLRKKQGLTINDRVTLLYATESPELAAIIEKYKVELKGAVLAKEIRMEKKLDGIKIDIEKFPISIGLIKD